MISTKPTYETQGQAAPRGSTIAGWLVLLGSLLATGATLGAEVNVQLDRQRAVVGETVTLIIETSDPRQSLETDLTALEQDFTVLNQRSESRMSIVNGRQTATVRILVTLEPTRAGRLVIPPLEFRDARSEPVSIDVEPAPELAEGEAPPVFIELEVTPADGPFYVHAQLGLTVRVFYQQNLTEASMQPLEPENATVRQLDEVPFQADRGGVQYRVLERRYAVFPERSGTLEIPSMKLTGRLVERPTDRLWQPAVRGRRVTIQSEPLQLDILPRPAEFTADRWLPARELNLAGQVTDVDALRVGEPVTRTIIVDAVGLEEHMLVAPEWPELENARVYPDQPQGITRDDGQWVLGHREYRYAVVPEREGDLVLPELQLSWWDTAENRTRTAVLPEQVLRVAPSDLAAGGPSAGGEISQADGEAGVFDLPAELIRQTQLNSPWRWVALAFALLWLGTLVVAMRRQPAANRSDNAVPALSATERERLRDLEAACRSGDPSQARNALGRWMRHHGPGARGDGLAQRAQASGHENFATAVRSLESAGFGPGESGAWDGKALWAAVSDWRRHHDSRDRSEDVSADLFNAAKAAH